MMMKPPTTLACPAIQRLRTEAAQFREHAIDRLDYVFIARIEVDCDLAASFHQLSLCKTGATAEMQQPPPSSPQSNTHHSHHHKVKRKHHKHKKGATPPSTPRLPRITKQM